MRINLVLASSLFLIFISGCSSTSSSSDARTNPVKETIIDGLNRPWSMVFLGEMEVLLAEKDGDILRLNLQSGDRSVITGLPEDVARAIAIDTTKYKFGIFPGRAHNTTQSFNAGWFQLLLDPSFEKNKFVYLSYAAENEKRESALKVIRGRLVDDVLEDVKTLFLAAPYSHGLFHYGGGMVFGADELLYISTGERNLFEINNPELPLAQDLTEKRGKIIRIFRDGSMPNDNPDFGENAVPGLYAIGIRAAQGLILNEKTGEIWFTEHGTRHGDEINILTPGVNYGWPYVTTGDYRTPDYDPIVPEGLEFEDPVHYWDQTVAPTGLAIYRGEEFPNWRDDLIIPGLSKGSLWRVRVDGRTITNVEELFVNDRVRLRKAVVSPGGALYLLTDEEDGKIIRLRNNGN